MTFPYMETSSNIQLFPSWKKLLIEKDVGVGKSIHVMESSTKKKPEC